ncbi:MAG: response regulator [Myxococcales bacterium]
MSSGLGLRVLCVEDEEASREALALLLEAEGYDVAVAESAEAGLQLLSKQEFHLVITDFALPGHNGTWMLREAKQKGHLGRAAAIMVTANPSPERMEGVPIIRKPVDVDNFLRKIFDVLAPARDAELERTRNELKTMRPAAAVASAVRTELVLYISAASPSSLKALRNMQRLLKDFDGAQVKFEVCDLSRDPHPPMVEEDRVAFTPTLVKRFPGPRTWILGDLDNAQIVSDLLTHSGVERSRK